jgi:hypothetical protein
VQKPTEYRAYIARSDRQFDGFVSMFYVDDAEAIEKVKELDARTNRRGRYASRSNKLQSLC